MIPEVRIKYNGVNVRIVDPGFKAFDNIKILEAGLASIFVRLKANRSEEDGYNKPLKQSYARKKKRLGANPWRDLSLTGEMIAGIKVRYASDAQAIAEASGRLGRIKASKWRQLMMFSPNDQKAMLAVATKIFGQVTAQALQFGSGSQRRTEFGRSSAGRRTGFARAA